MLKIFQTKKKAAKQVPTLTQEDGGLFEELELFEELDDADLLTIIGGIDANVNAGLGGNVVQVPVHIPVNVCGNSVSVIGLLNPSFGNTCINA